MLNYSHENNVVEKINLIYTASPLSAQNRNAICGQAGDSSHVFMVDADMTFPKDTLEKMLKASEEHANSVITGIAFMGAPPFYPSIYKWNEEFQSASPIAEWGEEPFEVDAAGSFGMLIPTPILMDIGPGPFSHMFAQVPENPGKATEVRHDFAFCKRVREKGYKIICLPELEFGHIRPYPITHFDWEDSKRQMTKVDTPPA